MLKDFSSYWMAHVLSLKRSWSVLRAKPFATLLTTFVIAMVLTLPTLFWIASHNLQQLAQTWQSTGHITLYLKTSLSAVASEDALLRVRSSNGVAEAIFKSPAEGLAELQQQEGMQDIMQYLPDNPLPAVIDVVPTLTINSPEKLAELFQQLKAYPFIEQAQLDMQWVNRLYTIVDVITTLTDGLMLLLALTVAFIIGNTLRMSIHAHQEEIQVLKLIGATDAFIIRPFLYTGVWYALSGALTALLVVNLFVVYLDNAINHLASVYQMAKPLLGLSFEQSLLFLLFAVFLGWFGTIFSIKRHLASIEPCN